MGTLNKQGVCRRLRRHLVANELQIPALKSRYDHVQLEMAHMG